MKKLTERQKNILSFISNQVEEKGYPPSVREIAQAVGLSSSSTVHGHLDRLEKNGYIKRDPTKPRAIELLVNQSFQVTAKIDSKEEAERLFRFLREMRYDVIIK